MNTIIISGYQKLMLNKWEKGLLTDWNLIPLLRARADQIPCDITDDKEAILYLIKNSKVYTDVHFTINFYVSILERYKLSRAEHSRIQKMAFSGQTYTHNGITYPYISKPTKTTKP